MNQNQLIEHYKKYITKKKIIDIIESSTVTCQENHSVLIISELKMQYIDYDDVYAAIEKHVKSISDWDITKYDVQIKRYYSPDDEYNKYFKVVMHYYALTCCTIM